MKTRSPRPTLQAMTVMGALLDAPDASGADLMRSAGLKSGTVYPILQRLEKAGWIAGRPEEAEPSKLGRPRRRMYRVSDLGRSEMHAWPWRHVADPGEAEDLQEADETRLNATLAPCPHCGPMPAAPELVLSDVSRRWQVFCGPCGSSSGSSKEPQGAVDSWNSRCGAGASVPSTPAALTTIAVLIGNAVQDLSPSVDPPIHGFSSSEKQTQAYALARRIVMRINTGAGTT